jgi:hypothetical protein
MDDTYLKQTRLKSNTLRAPAASVRIADSSEAVAVVNHVVGGSAKIRGLRESISEACGYSARGLK